MDASITGGRGFDSGRGVDGEIYEDEDVEKGSTMVDEVVERTSHSENASDGRGAESLDRRLSLDIRII